MLGPASTAYIASNKANTIAIETKEALEKLQATIDPMSKIYTNSGTIWTVAKYLFTFIVILAGLLLTLKELFKK